VSTIVEFAVNHDYVLPWPKFEEGAGLIIAIIGPSSPGIDSWRIATNPYNYSEWQRIADIHGQPAYQVSQLTAIVVPDFHGGTLMAAATSDRGPHKMRLLLSYAELTKVAEGVRWVGVGN